MVMCDRGGYKAEDRACRGASSTKTYIGGRREGEDKKNRRDMGGRDMGGSWGKGYKDGNRQVGHAF